MSPLSLEEKRRRLPRKPGVYLFKNRRQQIIYIGKALSLRHRVANYFQDRPLDPKTARLVSQIADLDYLVVNSEFEALLLEAKLVGEYQPKYNIQLKDSKSPLYLGVSRQPPARIFPLRRPELDGSLKIWFGPFLSSQDLRQLLRRVRHVFPFRSCRVLPKKPCLYYHLKLCPGVCVFSDPEYARTVARLQRLFGGQMNRLKSQLKKEMTVFSRGLAFEKAAQVKKQLAALEDLTGSWRNVPVDSLSAARTLVALRHLIAKESQVDPGLIVKIEGYDISNLGTKINVGSLVAFLNGQPSSADYRRFKIRSSGPIIQDDPASLAQVVSRRLHHPDWVYPQLFLIDGGKTQLTAVMRVLKEENLLSQIAVAGLTKKEEVLIIPRLKNGLFIGWRSCHLPRRSPVLRLLQQVRDESHRFAQNYYKNLNRLRLLR